MKPKKGRLTVIAGPMFSGKTGKLVSMIDVYTKMGYLLVTVKPTIDNRYSKAAEIHTHDHRVSQAILIAGETPEKVIDHIISVKANIVIFDEVQFFERDKIIAVIKALKKTGIHIIAAGLLYDYKRQPFGATADLLGLADERLELFAVCQKCGSIARHTERMRGGRGQVLIGATGMYRAVCEKCHRIYK
jgi:thymidine kinase